MAFTSYQKSYIKRNYERSSVETMAATLGLPEEEINKYLKKHLPSEKYDRYVAMIPKSDAADQTTIHSFNFKKFVFQNRFMYFALTVLVVIVYFNSLDNEFVSDDLPGIKNNPHIGDFSALFNSPYLFLTNLHYFIIYILAELNTTAYRLSNLLFHIGSTWLLFCLISLLRNKKTAFITSSLFAVHPILVESIVWISGGPYARYTFFFLLSFLLYLLSKNSKKAYIYSLIAFVVAIMWAEKAVVLCLLFASYELAWGDLKANWKKVAPYFAIGFILGLLAFLQVGTRMQSIESLNYNQSSGYNPFFQIPIAITSYFQLLFWPGPLTLYHTEMSFGTGSYVLRLLVTIIVLAGALFAFFKNRKIFFIATAFFVPLLPFLTPLGISWIVAERYVYLSSIAFFILFAIVADRLTSQEKQKQVVYPVIAIILIALSIRTVVRNIDWKNEDNLWFATAKTSPSGANIHNNLGDVYGRRGDYEKAVQEFQKAVEINPNYADALHNLANTYHAMGRRQDALDSYNKALSVNPNIWQTYVGIADISYEISDFPKAKEHLLKAMELNPNDPQLAERMKLIEENMQ